MEVVDKVKKGFKRTELGLIPEDWDVIRIADLFNFVGGSQPPRNTFHFKNGKGLIRLIQIRDYKTDKYKTFIPEELAQKKCNESDIMIGRYGPPIFQILRGIKGAYNVALIKAMPTSILFKEYGFYILKQKKLFDFVEKLSQRSSGQTGVDLNQLNSYLVPFPPTLTEQKAIAEALSSVDALIEKQQALIAKKKAIKEGAMQKLLTPPHKGGQRLPGFDGEWEEKKLGEVVKNISSGSSDTKSENGKYPIYGSTGIIGKKSYYDYNGEKVLVARVGANAGNLYSVNGEYCVSDNTLMISVYDDTVYSGFLYSYLKQMNLNNLVFGSGQPLITGSQLKNLTFYKPCLKEQKAIAQILSDMDLEIEKLQAEKAKYQKIKEGMMQELLTGKTRLV